MFQPSDLWLAFWVGTAAGFTAGFIVSIVMASSEPKEK